jgi:hypothetical protein
VDYRNGILLHANRSSKSHVYPGENYIPVRDYFVKYKADELRSNNINGGQRNTEPFLVLHDLSLPEDDRMHSFGGVDGPIKFEQHVLSKGPHLLFIRGFCPPEWLERINAKIPIDPELCQRHLHLDPTDVVKNNLYTSPQLPSASVNTLQLPFTTTCSRVKDVQGGENLKHERLNASKNMAAYHDVLPRITPMGDSIIRKYDLLSRSDFVVEQTVTACVSVTTDSWTGMSHTRELLSCFDFC